VVLPIGSYKGSGLSMLMDILGGVISGAAFAAAWRTNTVLRPPAGRRPLF
jgi:LDH2 family malate/lactate/ureidoglycolate dehydrogenase